MCKRGWIGIKGGKGGCTKGSGGEAAEVSSAQSWIQGCGEKMRKRMLGLAGERKKSRQITPRNI